MTLWMAWWRFRRALVVFGGQVWLGFVVMGGYFGTLLPEGGLDAVVTELRFLREMPPGHPERPAADQPPTPQEAVLWEQLAFLDQVR